MKNKHYTPDLSEFHIGFEYQMKETFGDGTVKTKEQFDNAKWIEATINSLNCLPYVERTLVGKNSINGLCGIRVKFLDKKDIESSGWGYKCTKNNIDMYMLNGKVKLTLFNDLQTSLQRIFFLKHKKQKIFFEGALKNKSELNKLMQQLGIK